MPTIEERVALLEQQMTAVRQMIDQTITPQLQAFANTIQQHTNEITALNQSVSKLILDVIDLQTGGKNNTELVKILLSYATQQMLAPKSAAPYSALIRNLTKLAGEING